MRLICSVFFYFYFLLLLFREMEMAYAMRACVCVIFIYEPFRSYILFILYFYGWMTCLCFISCALLRRWVGGPIARRQQQRYNGASGEGREKVTWRGTRVDMLSTAAKWGGNWWRWHGTLGQHSVEYETITSRIGNAGTFAEKRPRLSVHIWWIVTEEQSREREIGFQFWTIKWRNDKRHWRSVNKV